MKKYHVKEMFYTIQGEGFHAGRAAVFCRFTGCNVWSGKEKDRERDTKKGFCAAICDTDFVGTDGENGGKYTHVDLAEKAASLFPGPMRNRFIVFTGGEPSMQLDEKLCTALRQRGFYIAIETNGSRQLPAGINWVTLSPKPPMPIHKGNFYDEIKVLIGTGLDPADFDHIRTACRYVQPVDHRDNGETANSHADAVRWVMQNPTWRLSLQTHKITGVK